ncbi:AsnC family transcriptional regulator [Burkholderia pseudomallei]|nr:AsnC family transcriptional regulator [Burkholderia pseudomallei]CAJ7555217.1 AsnC family transcriptional regulator [Burkholderia pseudomallei]
MKTCIALRAVPELRELREGLSTVDYMTAAIAHIARNPAAPGKKFNLTHSGERNLSLEDFFDRLERAFGFSFARVPFRDWFDRWKDDAATPLYPVLNLFRDPMHGGMCMVELDQHTYRWEHANTSALLAGSGVRPPEFDEPELRRHLVQSIGIAPACAARWCGASCGRHGGRRGVGGRRARAGVARRPPSPAARCGDAPAVTAAAARMAARTFAGERARAQTRPRGGRLGRAGVRRYHRGTAIRRSAMRPPRLDQLDDLDRNLVALLQANARASVADLARQLGVARTTVLARIARLERTQVIAGYSVRLGQDVLDASIYAYVGIILAPKYGKDVLKRLDRMPEVQLLCAVSGEYDYVAWLRADSPERLNDLLDQIGALEGVERTTTSIILARKIDRGTLG